MRPWVTVFFLPAVMCACGSSTPASGIDAGHVGTDVPGTSTDGGVPVDNGPGGLPGSYYCAPSAMPPTCHANEHLSCGACVITPTPVAVVTRTACNETTLNDNCDPSNTPGPANLNCFNPATPPVAGTPQNVTLWGDVRPFGNGGDSQHIRINVFTVGADRRPVMPPLGTTVSDVTAPGNRIETVLQSDRMTVAFMRTLGGYQIPNVPTETELIIEAVGDSGDTTAMGLWSHPLYDYDIMIHNNQVVTLPSAGGDGGVPSGITGSAAVFYEPRVLATSDWSAIPSAATLVTGIPAGHGVLAGEVHDCDDVRLNNATVGSNPRVNFSLGTVYFSDNDTNPLPDTSRMYEGTSILGTYALLDMTPGLATVAATGYVSTTQLAHLGSDTVWVFPDAVTAITFRGLRPWQVPH